MLLDPDFHAQGDPHSVWRWMRKHEPVHHQPESEYPAFWSLTRYADVRAAYRNPAMFSSERGVLLRPLRAHEDLGGGLTLALTDPPRHRRLRSAMADWFSERAVRELTEFIAATTRQLLAQAATAGECDLVTDLVGRLSMYVIGHIIGFPAEDHELLFDWTDAAFHAGMPLAAHPDLMRYVAELMAQRTRQPRHDLISQLLLGTVEDELLSEEEILFNCENLIGATENGRLSLSGGIVALLQDQQQLQLLRHNSEVVSTAIDEVLRWTSSATHSMRTTTEEVEIGGHQIGPGEKVVLWLPSANRDESVFDDPDRFDITRQPNRHLALGSGEHVCIGGVLARAQLRQLIAALLDPDLQIALAGPVSAVASIAVGGPQRVPARVTFG